MLFLLIVSVLILIAFLIVLPPLWRKHPVAEADQDQRNIAIARQRLAELKEQLQAGALTQALYDEQLVELEQALSDDLDIESHVNASPSQGRWMALVLMLAIPFVTGSLYWALGNYPSLTQVDQPAAANQATPELEQMKSMVAGLAERLQKQPDDALGWTMLGRSYKYLQQYPKAVEAFEHAYRLIGDQPEIMLLYADALAFANNEQMAGKPSELVFKALAMEPNNVTGLWLGGMAKAQIGDFAAAMDLWKKLEAQLPAGSEAQQEIQGLLVKLSTQVPAGTAAQAEAKPVQPAKAVNIDVQVSLAPELQKSASPNDTVFIYAQALSGPKMPLAIVRKQVSELPVTVNLTDAMAMMPTMKLSNFEQVKLLARISKSGDAIQKPGDLIGVVEQIALTDKGPHKVVINSQIK
ncbi:MAG: c-type cytochrome biogenesis protein CcmI [Methylobacter sp.]|uniref:c-type cytochrome biogenesis protein CcmI n=1 Tax=Methylobacter sp. TaxID=2051955 RepID=UPI0027313E37|nr:c-type cytochrome biogenesis protein CcmI [Methylobacter sp.]MDP1665740.1 c-type cytochrome biogenesis protein CcmI [Methylobacter sp.]MDP1969434.1 c-type cytochrome biogenesis protein CcmI [Methylobacter sp.]